MIPNIDARNGCYGNDSQVSCGNGAQRDAATGQIEDLLSARNETPAGIKYDGNLLPAMTAMVTGFVDTMARRALAANRVIDRIQPCPSGADCLSGQKHERIFACEFCENFKGCSDCVSAHEAEAHWTDSDTAREMHS